MEDSNELPAEPKVYSLDDIGNMFLQGNKQAPSAPATPAYTPIPPFVPASQRTVAPAQPQVAPKALSLEDIQAMFMQGNKPRKWTGNAAADSFNDPDPLTEDQKVDRAAQLEYEKALGGKKDPLQKFRPKSTSVSNTRGSAVRGSASTGDEPTVGYWKSIGNSLAKSWIRGEGDESGNRIDSALADRAQYETENKNLIKARDELIAKSKTNIVPNLQISVAEYNQIIKSNNDRIALVDKALPRLFIKANADAASMVALGGKNETQKQFDEAMKDPRNDFWDALKEGTDADNFGGVALNYLNIGTNVASESAYQMAEAIGLNYAMAGLGTYFKLAKSTKNVMSAVAIGTATGIDSFDANMRQNMEQKLVALKINPKDLNAVAEFAKNNPEKWLKMFSESRENAVRKGAGEGAATVGAAFVMGKIGSKFETIDRAKSLGAAIAGKELPKDSIGKAVAKGVGSMAGEMISEGIEEGGVQAITNAVDEKFDAKDTLAATFSGAMAGGVSKGVMGAAGKAGSKIFSKKEATAEQKAMEAEVEAAKNKPVEESDQNVEASPAWPLFQKYGSDIPESELTEDIIKGHNEWAAKNSQTHHVDGSAMTAEEIDQHLDGLELKKTAMEAVVKQNRVPPKPPMIHPIDRKNWEKKYGDTHYNSGVPLFDEKLSAQVDAKVEEMKKAGWQPKRPRAVKKGQAQSQAQAQPDQQAAQPQAEAQTQTKPDGSVEPRPSYSGDHNDTNALIAWKKAYDDWNSKYEKTHDWWTGEPLTPKESAAQEQSKPATQSKPGQTTAPKPDEYTEPAIEASNETVEPAPVDSTESRLEWLKKYRKTHNYDGSPMSAERIDSGQDFIEAIDQIRSEDGNEKLTASEEFDLAKKRIADGTFKSKRKRTIPAAAKPTAQPAPAKPVETRTVGDMQDQLNKLELAGQGDTRQAERLRTRIAAAKEAQAKPEPKPEPVAAQPEQKPVQAAEQPAAKAEKSKPSAKTKNTQKTFKLNASKISNPFAGTPLQEKTKMGTVTQPIDLGIAALSDKYAIIKSGTNSRGEKLNFKREKVKPKQIESAHKLYNYLIKVGAIVPDETHPSKFRERDPLIDSDGNKYTNGMRINIEGDEYIIALISKDNKSLTLYDEDSYYEIDLDKLLQIIRNQQIEKNGGKTDKQLLDEVVAERERDNESASDSMPRDPVAIDEENEDPIKKGGKQVKDPVRKNSVLNKELSGDIDAARGMITDYESVDYETNEPNVEMTDEERKIAAKLITELFEIGTLVLSEYDFGKTTPSEVEVDTPNYHHDLYGGETIQIKGYVYQIVSIKNNTVTLRNIKTGESYEWDAQKLQDIREDEWERNRERDWSYTERPGYKKEPKYVMSRDRERETSPDRVKANDSEIARLVEIANNERKVLNKTKPKKDPNDDDEDEGDFVSANDQIYLKNDYEVPDGLFLVVFSFQSEENFKDDVRLFLSFDQIKKLIPHLEKEAIDQANFYLADAGIAFEVESGIREKTYRSSKSNREKTTHRDYAIAAVMRMLPDMDDEDGSISTSEAYKKVLEKLKKYAKNKDDIGSQFWEVTKGGKEYNIKAFLNNGKIVIRFGENISFDKDDIIKEAIKYWDNFRNKNKDVILKPGPDTLPKSALTPGDVASKVSKFKNMIPIIKYILNANLVISPRQEENNKRKPKYQEKPDQSIKIKPISKDLGISSADVSGLIDQLETAGIAFVSGNEEYLEGQQSFDINDIKIFLRAVLKELSPESVTEPTAQQEAAPVADQPPAQAVAVAEDGKEPANITQARAQLKKLIKSGMTFMGGRQRDQADALRKTIAEYEQSVKSKKDEAGEEMDTPEESKSDEQRSEVSEISEAVTDTLTNIEGSKDLMKALNGSKTKPGLVQKLEEQISAAEEAIDSGDQQALSDATDSMSALLDELTGVRDELQDKHDNTPESLQETDAYYAREEAIDSLTEAIDTIENSISNLVQSINTEDDQATTAEDTTAEAEMKKGEFNLSGEDVTEVKDQAEDTTGDMVPDTVEPAYVAQARTQLAKLEKSGKSERQQQTLRETIAEYEASKGKPAQEAPKPENKSKKTKTKKEPKPYKPGTIDVIRQRFKENKYPKRPSKNKPDTFFDDREAIIQYEEDRKLFSFDRSVDLSAVSTEALEDFDKLTREKSSEITSNADGEFAALADLELERRKLESDDQVTSFGDIVADIRGLANRGIFLPTLPKEFKAEELEKFANLKRRNKFLFRNPRGMDIGKVNAEDQKSYGTGKGKIVDRQHIIDMKSAADGMISKVAEALAGMGWTQIDPSNVGNFADVLAELIENNDEGVVPAGGLGGASRDTDNIYKRKYTLTEPETLSNINQIPDAETDQEYGDETMPDNPEDMPEDNGDNPFSMRDKRDKNQPGQVSDALIKKLESIADKPMTTTEAVNLIESLLKDEAIKNGDGNGIISVAQALDFLKTLSKSKIDKTTITFRKHYFAAMGQGYGIFDTKNKTIEISIPGVTYGYNEISEKWENNLGSVLPTVTAHEVIHYHTEDALAKDRVYRKEVNRIFNAAKVWMADVNDDVKKWYGFTNVYEFLAEGLTNKYFINLLKQMPSQGSNFDFSGDTDQNLFNELVAATKAMFARNGVNVDGTVLEDIINSYAYAKASMKDGSESNPLSMRDNPTTPSGEVANHGDADLASRGFVSKYAKDNMPEGMNLTLTFGMGPIRQSVKPSQVSNYQGGMANGTLMNKGKVIATFEFDVEPGSSEYDGGVALHWMGVTKSRRNLGLSKIMVAEIAERARRMGATSMYATVLDPAKRPMYAIKSVLGSIEVTEEVTEPADTKDEYSWKDGDGNNVRTRTEVTSGIDQDTPLSLREKATVEQKAAELDRRIMLNAANKYLGTLIGRRGYQGIIDRAVFEARKSGKLTEKEIQGLTSILNYIGSQFFANVKLSIDKGNENAIAMGQYDAAQKIIKIFKTAINNGLFLDTAAHEIAHHLTQFLPEADRVALRKEWKDARIKFLKENPGFASLVGNDDRNWMNIKIKGTDLEAANKLYPDISKNKLFSQIPNSNPNAPIMYRIIATDETYRLFSSSEWFAETFKDIVNKRLNSDPAYTGNQKTWRDKLTNLWENIKMKFRQMFGKDQAARILSNFAKGRYDASKFQEDNGTNVNAEGYDVNTEEDARTIAEVDVASNMPNMYVDEQNDDNNEDFYNSIKDAEDLHEDTVFIEPRNKGDGPVKRAADFVVQIGRGISGRMHRYARKNPNSPTVKKLANWIHSRAGTKSDAFERDIPTSISVKRAYFINKFRKILGPMEGTLNSFKNTPTKTAKQLREDVYKHLNDMITGRTEITPGALGQAATELRALFQELRDYRVEAGEEIGFVEDYFPAVYNRDSIINNRAQFVGDATAAYMIELNKLSEAELAKELGLSKEEIETGDIFENVDDLEQKMTDLAQMKAIELYNSHVRGEASDIFDNMFSNRGSVKIENPAKSRKFGRQAQDIMRKWQVNDPFRVVTRYIMGSVKRAELIRKFGMDNTVWKNMATQMEKDGVNYNVIISLAEMIRVATGSDKDERSIGRRNTEQGLIDSVTLITAASAMGKGFWNNLAEPISIGIRSGSPVVNSLRAYAETWGVFIKLAARDLTGRKEKGIFADSMWEEYGKDMGLIHNNLEDAWMTTHSIDAGGEDSDPRLRRWTNLIYKANLMDASETAKQRASLSIGNSYISNLANLRQGNHWWNKLIQKLNLSNENWNPAESVSDNLNELGIPPERHDEFTKWVVSIQNLKGRALMNVITGNSEMARFHQEAIVRFSNQSSVRSSKAHKTETQNTFVGKILLQLLSFAYSYAAEVSSRVYDMAKQAVLASPEGKRYNMVDRMRMLAPVVGSVLSVLVYRGLLEFKDWLYETEGSKKRKKFPEWLKWFNAASYSGLFGPVIEQSFKIIGRDMTVGGPAGSVVSNTGKAVVAGVKAGTGQGKSEAAVSAARTAAAPILKGAAVAVSSSIHPALGAAAVQITNRPEFSNAIAPPKAEKTWFEKRN